MSEQVSKPAVDEEDAMGAALVELREAKAAGVTLPADEPVVAATPAEPAAAATPDDKTTQPKAADAPAPAAEKSLEQQLADKRAELHRLNSDIGRVSALNAKATKAETESAELRRQLEEARKPPKTEAEARSKLTALREQVKDFPELKNLVDVFDEVLRDVDAKAGATAKAAAQEAIKPLAPLQEKHLAQEAEQAEAAHAADRATFHTTYPTAVAVVQTDDFKNWLPKQSKALQWSFYKGETESDALPVMDAYDAHLRRIGKPPIASTPTSQQPAAPDLGKPAEVAQANDRLSRATGLPSRAAGAGKGGLPAQDDFDGSLEFWRNKSAEARRAAAA